MGKPSDQLRDQRHVLQLAGSNAQGHLGRSRKRKTKRIAPCVSEKLAILLSTRPAASPASMRSVSLRGLRPPFGRTTQIAPLGSIHDLTCTRRSRSRLSLAPMKTRSHGPFGLPTTISEVRSRNSFTNEASPMWTSATLAPGLTPSLSRSGLVVSATDGSKHNDPQ